MELTISTRSSFWKFVSPCTWGKRCMKKGRCRWVDWPSKEHETFCEYICCEPKNKAKRKTQGERTFHVTDLRTVWPSTPVCSKFIPAEPSAQTIICSYRVISTPFPVDKPRPNIPYHTICSYTSQPARLLLSYKSRTKSCYTNPPDYPEWYHPSIRQKAPCRQFGDRICYACLQIARREDLTKSSYFPLRGHR